MDKENMWRKKERTRVSYGNRIGGRKAAEVESESAEAELKAEQQAHPCQTEHKLSKHQAKSDNHLPAISNSILKNEETNIQDQKGEGRKEKAAQSQLQDEHFDDNVNKLPEAKHDLPFAKTESIREQKNLTQLEENVEFGSDRNKISTTDEKLENSL